MRREKEIVEVQYELKVQEAKRLKQQLDYTQSQLDESRLKLDQERRLHADLGRSSTMHKDTMEQLQELHLHREASVTLRNEARQAQTQLAEKTRQVEELIEQMRPLETKIRELEHGKEIADGEMRLLQEDRDRWQKRTQDIISKYDRIDPAEMEDLKKKVENYEETIEILRGERDKLLEEQQQFSKEKLEALETEKAGWQQSRKNLIEQAKEKARLQTITIRERTAERDTAAQEKEALQQRLSALEQELESAVQEKNIAEQKVLSIGQELESVKSERSAQAPLDSSQPTATQASAAALPDHQAIEALNFKIDELQKQLDEVSKGKQALAEQLATLREELEQANLARDAAMAEAAEARKHIAQAPASSTNDCNEEGQIDENPKFAISDDERKNLEDRIAVAEIRAREAERKATEIEEAQEITLKQRSEKMKASLNKKLQESKEAQKAQLQADLEAEYKLRLEQEKRIWLAENKSGPVPLAVTPSQLKQTEEAKELISATNVNTAENSGGTEPCNLSNLSDAQIHELLSNDPMVKKILAGLSDAQVRDFLAASSVARSILASNIKKKLEVETQKLRDQITKLEAEIQKLKEEHEKTMADAQQKAETAQTQAVLMMEKKSSLQLNMAQNQSKSAKAKLAVVEKAAKETPTKAVSEVWATAKDAKPPAALPAPVAGMLPYPRRH